MSCWHLDEPSAPLAHLTRLSLTRVYAEGAAHEGAAPLRRLATAAPLLEVLSCVSGFDHGTAAAL